MRLSASTQWFILLAKHKYFTIFEEYICLKQTEYVYVPENFQRNQLFISIFSIKFSQNEWLEYPHSGKSKITFLFSKLRHIIPNTFVGWVYQLFSLLYMSLPLRMYIYGPPHLPHFCCCNFWHVSLFRRSFTQTH